MVLAAVVMLLFAVGVDKGRIDVMSEDPMSQFTDFLLDGFEEDGAPGEKVPESSPEGEDELIVTPQTSRSETTTTAKETTAEETTTTASGTTTEATTAATTEKKTTTTTTAASTSKTTTSTTAKTTTQTTTAAKTTTAKTTVAVETATEAKTTTTQKTTTATNPTEIHIDTATEPQATETKPAYANAEYVVDPNYESPYYIVVFAGKSQSVAIYTKDAGGKYSVLTRCFTCSTGAPETPTRTGQYKIRAKYRWRWLEGNVYGQYNSSISSSYLFHSVPYLKENERTLDMTEYDKLGTQASHGCIRLCVRDTKWIYDNCPIGTQVNIVNKSGPSGAGVPSLNYDAKYKGWDPSDPHSDNPYK